MPNTQVTIYLNDDEYILYSKDKEGYNKIAREAFLIKINEDKKGDSDGEIHNS